MLQGMSAIERISDNLQYFISFVSSQIQVQDELRNKQICTKESVKGSRLRHSRGLVKKSAPKKKKIKAVTHNFRC